MKLEHIYFGVFLGVVITFTYFLQTRMLLSADVSYLLHVSKQLWAGGTYITDFFETNPPMILYLYLPVIFLHHITPLSLDQALQFYVVIAASVSLIICYGLLKQIFNHQEHYRLYGLLLAFVFVLFYQPANQFGQREHILMIVILPYILSTVLVLENRPIHPFSAFCMGFFAALGISLKPFFLFPLVFIEMYLMYQKRSLWAWVRIETLTILSVLIIYLYSILIFHPNYFKLLLPLINSFYFIGYADSWIDLFFNYVTIYCVLAVMIYSLFKKTDIHRHFTTVIMLAMLGMVVAFIVPRMAWSYHLMPATGFAVILLTYYFMPLITLRSGIKQNKLTLCSDMIISFFIGVIFYICPLYLDGYYYWFFAHEKNFGDRQLLVQFIEKLPGSYSLTCLSTFTTTCFPLAYHSHVVENNIGRFPFFWWILGMMKWDKMPKNEIPKQILQQKQFIFNQFVADIKRYKPTLIVLQTHDQTSEIAKDFDYIHYFSTDKDFRDEWKNYHFLKEIAFYKIYQRNARE